MMYRITHGVTGRFVATVPYDELWRFPDRLYTYTPVGHALPARPQLAADVGNNDPWPDHPRR